MNGIAPRIIDITQPLFGCAVYPGDTPPTFTRVRSIPPDNYNLTDVSLCAHNGTHVDAPLHFIEGGVGVGELSLDIFYGECAVKVWDGVIPPDCERLLIKGGHALTENDAEAIVRAGVRLVGVESQSVGAADAPMAVHLILLGAGVIPLEGLNLAHVEEGRYTLAAFPLNLGETDGAPARAVLINEFGKDDPL